MGQIFDFGKIENSEKTIRKTWTDFRNSLANGEFTYDEIEKAKKSTFLKTYDDLFNQHSGIEHKTITIKNLDGLLIGRGTILDDDEVPNYERFIPKKEYIKKDNRFSPPGVEWLYLAIGNELDIHQCSQAECRVEKGNRFGFCHFTFDDSCMDLRLVDLSIVDNISYHDLNAQLENYGQKQVKKGIKIAKTLGFIPKHNVNVDEFKRLFTEWGAYTHTKLLSEQIFVPIQDTDDRSIMYAPFQTMAQYYISLGYSGIIYGSTVSNLGRNIVLFDKKIAFPSGAIEDYAGETIMCFGGEKYKDYVRKCGLPYASKEINKSRIYYLKEHKKVKFSTLVGSIVNDFIGPAYGFESDVIWELLDDNNLKYSLEEE